eukprot:3022169-Rhodomonas_salina.2
MNTSVAAMNTSVAAIKGRIPATASLYSPRKMSLSACLVAPYPTSVPDIRHSKRVGQYRTWHSTVRRHPLVSSQMAWKARRA